MRFCANARITRNYAMSINTQTGKRAFVGTILVPIAQCERTV